MVEMVRISISSTMIAVETMNLAMQMEHIIVIMVIVLTARNLYQDMHIVMELLLYKRGTMYLMILVLVMVINFDNHVLPTELQLSDLLVIPAHQVPIYDRDDIVIILLVLYMEPLISHQAV